MNVEFLRTDAIQILDTRQRKTVSEDHIKSLALDIMENGLIHPPTVTHDNILVAGFCRLTAVRALTGDFKFGGTIVPRGHIPVIRLDQARTALDLFRIEFAENEKRANLTPVERSAALAHLHRNLEAMAKEKGEAWSMQKTAAEVVKLEGGDAPPSRQNDVAGEVSDALIIDSFKDDPDVASAPTKAAAVKIAKKKMEEQFSQMLGAMSMQEAEGKEVDDTYRVFRGDFRDFPLEEGAYAGIICDPPYGIGADSFGDQSYATGHQYKDDEANALEVARAILLRGFTAVQPGGHCYLFCDIRRWSELKNLAEKAGWYVWPTPLIWDKGMGHAPQPGYFSRQYEAILFCMKGATRRLTKTSPDVIRIPAQRDKIHAAQKPVDLYVHLMRLSFLPGERVVDFTTGSGTIFKAAAEAGLRADGWEKDEKYFHINQQVIAGLRAAPPSSGPRPLLDEEDEEV